MIQIPMANTRSTFLNLLIMFQLNHVEARSTTDVGLARWILNEVIVAMDEAEVALGQSLAAFMSACTPIEQHLLDGKPLTDTYLELISTVTLGLQMALVVWKQKNGIPIKRPADFDGHS